MASGTGIGGPLLDGGIHSKYKYRHRMGMLPSAEWTVFFDDFVNGCASNVPTGWEAAVIDAGATTTTITTATVGANGVVSPSDATASEGAAFYMEKNVQLISGKKFYMEMLVRTDDVTDNAVQFGLSALTATTNPEDLWTTAAADVVAFGLLDGSAYPQMLVDAGNGGTSVQTQTNKIMVANTWHTLAIFYDGSVVQGYVDGELALTWSGASSTIPTAVALAPFVGHINGNGAGGNVVLVDYVKYVSQR